MIALDTNVLVRYFAQDDERQSPLATRLIDTLTAEQPGYVTSVVLAETTWVLSKAYRLGREHLSDVLEAILRARDLVTENAEAAYKALGAFRSNGGDFADCLIAEAARLAGCEATVTFDRQAALRAGMRLLA